MAHELFMTRSTAASFVCVAATALACSAPLSPTVPDQGAAEQPVDAGSPRELATALQPGALAPTFRLSATVERRAGRPLQGTVRVTAERLFQAEVIVRGPGILERVVPSEGLGRSHEVRIVGLRQSSTYDLEIRARDLGGNLAYSDATLTTGAIDGPVPEIVVTERVRGPLGPVMVGVNIQNQVRYLAFDEDGEVVWHYTDPARPGFATPLIRPVDDTGRYAMMLPNELRIVDAWGDTELVIEAPPGTEPFHHDFQILSDDRFLLLGTEQTTVTLPGEEPYTIVGDRIVEVDRAGHIQQQWSSFQHLSVDRFPGDLSRTEVGDEGALDWTHGNAITYRESDRSVLFSPRHQNVIVKIDWPTGRVEWILGEGGSFSLRGGSWFASQHAPTWVDGILYLYDNGNERPGGGDPFSRVVAYALDEEKGDAVQAFTWQTPYYTSFVGDVDPGLTSMMVTCGRNFELGRPGTIYEVTPRGDILWSAEVLGLNIYRSERIGSLTRPLTGTGDGAMSTIPPRGIGP